MIARFCAATFLIVLLSGCRANNPSFVETRDVLKTALNARQIGRTFDAGVRAADGNDVQDLSEKCDRLRAMGAQREADLLSLGAAENSVNQAVQFEITARASSTRKAQMLAQAAQQYRLALRLSPDFPS